MPWTKKVTKEFNYNGEFVDIHIVRNGGFWVMTCPQLNISNRNILSDNSDKQEAKYEAIRIVKEKSENIFNELNV